jgi:hypothetical protein
MTAWPHFHDPISGPLRYLCGFPVQPPKTPRAPGVTGIANPPPLCSIISQTFSLPSSRILSPFSFLLVSPWLKRTCDPQVSVPQFAPCPALIHTFSLNYGLQPDIKPINPLHHHFPSRPTRAPRRVSGRCPIRQVLEEAAEFSAPAFAARRQRAQNRCEAKSRWDIVLAVCRRRFPVQILVALTYPTASFGEAISYRCPRANSWTQH